jgi:rhodanese-related sulfurtransferase
LKIKSNLIKYISVLFLVLTGVLPLSISCQSGNNDNLINEDILVREAFQMIKENISNPDFIILDTRTPSEYQRGHISNSKFINYASSNFKNEIQQLDTSKVYLIYCHSGGRSKTTLNLMKKYGFKEAYNMIGGIVAWNKAGYKLVK